MAKKKRAKKAKHGDTCIPGKTTINRSNAKHGYELCRCNSTGRFTKKPNCKLAYK